jgi:hypothetical protein
MDDDFVPEGCLPLKTAIERLAKARQTPIQSAQAEIRAKAHSRFIVAYVINPGTGELAPISSDRWALDDARSWLEQGECILTDSRYIANFNPRFSGPHRATIFVFEKDLQRLIRMKPNAVTRPHTSRAEAEREFKNWRKDCGDHIPSLKEDCNHMKQFGVSRRRVIELREGVGVKKRSRGSPRQSKSE